MPASRWPLLALPAVLFLRMALNVIDGIMAKEHGQASPAGAVLNEIADVVADAALYLPFALILGLSGPLVVLVVVAGLVAEMTGARSARCSARRAVTPGRSARATARLASGCWRRCSAWASRPALGPRSISG
jgi:CDP-diacylglycerol--glycerol-3-phosphate 3-phosphatidyltransferase